MKAAASRVIVGDSSAYRLAMRIGSVSDVTAGQTNICGNGSNQMVTSIRVYCAPKYSMI